MEALTRPRSLGAVPYVPESLTGGGRRANRLDREPAPPHTTRDEMASTLPSGRGETLRARYAVVGLRPLPNPRAHSAGRRATESPPAHLAVLGVTRVDSTRDVVHQDRRDRAREEFGTGRRPQGVRAHHRNGRACGHRYVGLQGNRHIPRTRNRPLTDRIGVRTTRDPTEGGVSRCHVKLQADGDEVRTRRGYARAREHGYVRRPECDRGGTFGGDPDGHSRRSLNTLRTRRAGGPSGSLRSHSPRPTRSCRTYASGRSLRPGRSRCARDPSNPAGPGSVPRDEALTRPAARETVEGHVNEFLRPRLETRRVAHRRPGRCRGHRRDDERPDQRQRTPRNCDCLPSPIHVSPPKALKL